MKQIMSFALLTMAAGPAFATGIDPMPLAPHRAVYELALMEGSSGSRNIAGARGRIVFDFTGDACEGYALNYRQVTEMESSESAGKISDFRNTNFEAPDGTSFRFRTQSTIDRAAGETVEGTASRKNEALNVRLKQPKTDSFTLPPGTLFPSAHMKRLIETAKNGETTLTEKVFDGSEDGRKVYDTLAVIGKKIDFLSDETLEEPAQKDELKIARWPVTLSYFTEGQGERVPAYIISFDLYENGVSRALKLDYGDIVLKGTLKNLEFLKASNCVK